MRTALNRLIISIYILFVYLKNLFWGKYEKGQVIIIAPHIFGDATILQASLQGYVDLYKPKGLEILFLCRPTTKKFLEEVATIPAEIQVEEVDFTKLVNNFPYFREISKKYRYQAEIVIAPGTSMSMELLSTTFPTKQRYAFAQGKRNVWPPHIYIFFKLAYSDIIYPPIDMMQIQRHRMLLNHLGNKEYKGHIAHFKKLPAFINGNYCVICPGSSMFFKCWPLERYRDVADWIVDTYNYDVHICGGGKVEADMAEKLIRESKHKDRIISHVDKTSFAEWSSIVQHAKFVLGNDSATIHIAAATQTPSICIAGAYDKNQFFPYAIDELAVGDILPVTLLKDVSCRNCRTKSYHAGYGNTACLTRIKQWLCASCVDLVTIEEVKYSILDINTKYNIQYNDK